MTDVVGVKRRRRRQKEESLKLPPLGLIGSTGREESSMSGDEFKPSARENSNNHSTWSLLNWEVFTVHQVDRQIAKIRRDNAV